MIIRDLMKLWGKDSEDDFKGNSLASRRGPESKKRLMFLWPPLVGAVGIDGGEKEDSKKCRQAGEYRAGRSGERKELKHQ